MQVWALDFITAAVYNKSRVVKRLLISYFNNKIGPRSLLSKNVINACLSVL